MFHKDDILDHSMVNGTAKKSPSQIFFKIGMWILHLFLITMIFVS